jgi:general secretion pathway protein D
LALCCWFGLLVYKAVNRSAKYLSDVLFKIANASQLGSRPVASHSSLAPAAGQSEAVGSASSQIDRSAQDQLAYQCAPAECERLRKLLVQLDTPEAQVILRAVLYEVGTQKGQGSAVQMAAKVLSDNSSFSVSAGSVIAGAGQLHLAAGGLDAVVSLLDQDSRFKSVSRPMLRVRSGASAKFSVGQSVPILGAVTQDRNGNPIQSIEYKPSGTIFTVQPDIRQDVVDLNITQELSSFVVTTTGVNNSPTLMQRSATSTLGIKPGEVVLFAGLEETHEDETNARFFGFNIGKKTNDSTSELLLLIEAQKI